jgi:hypothetical protein
MLADRWRGRPRAKAHTTPIRDKLLQGQPTGDRKPCHAVFRHAKIQWAKGVAQQ